MRNDEQQQLALKILAQVGEALRQLSVEDLRQVEAGELRFGLIPKRMSKPRLARPRATESEDGVVAALSGLNSVDDGLDYLRRAKVTRTRLENLSRQLDLPVLRSDTAEQLRARIVEAVIGFQSRSNAIRGDGQPGSQGQHE